MLSPALGVFHQRYPKLRLHLEIPDTQQMNPALGRAKLWPVSLLNDIVCPTLHSFWGSNQAIKQAVMA